MKSMNCYYLFLSLSLLQVLNRRNIRFSAAGNGFSPIASPENLEDFVGVDLRGWTLDSENWLLYITFAMEGEFFWTVLLFD